MSHYSRIYQVILDLLDRPTDCDSDYDEDSANGSDEDSGDDSTRGADLYQAIRDFYMPDSDSTNDKLYLFVY